MLRPRAIKFAVAIAALGTCALAALVSLDRDPDVVAVGGAPSVHWNEPLFDWPQREGGCELDRAYGTCVSTPLPVLSPDEVALGTPLNIAKLDIPLGKPGSYRLDIGELAFDRGIHTRTFFVIANADEASYRIFEPHVEFRSLEKDGLPFTEIAASRPLFEGVERVEAVLVWDVDWALDGATLEIRDLVVE